jgi:hypothetical protein
VSYAVTGGFADIPSAPAVASTIGTGRARRWPVETWQWWSGLRTFNHLVLAGETLCAGSRGPGAADRHCHGDRLLPRAPERSWCSARRLSPVPTRCQRRAAGVATTLDGGRVVIGGTPTGRAKR